MTVEDGWNEWSKHVLAELQRVGKVIDTLEKSIENVRQMIINSGPYVTQDEMRVHTTDTKAGQATLGRLESEIMGDPQSGRLSLREAHETRMETGEAKHDALEKKFTAFGTRQAKIIAFAVTIGAVVGWIIAHFFK